MADLNNAIREYYVRYYRDDLGLPDWDSRATARLSEENIEGIHMNRMLKHIGSIKGMRVLNLGSGTGGFNVLAERQGASSFGVDVSMDGVSISKEKFEREGLPSGRFLASAGEDLPFASESFDMVYCLSVIEHVASVEKTLDEVMRVLKPGGVFYLVAPNYLNFYESHYKIFWLPKFPKALAKFYLRLRRRPAAFVDSLNYITPSWLDALLRRHPVETEKFRQDLAQGLSFKQRTMVRMREQIGLGHIEWAIRKRAQSRS